MTNNNQFVNGVWFSCMPADVCSAVLESYRFSFFFFCLLSCLFLSQMSLSLFLFLPWLLVMVCSRDFDRPTNQPTYPTRSGQSVYKSWVHKLGSLFSIRLLLFSVIVLRSSIRFYVAIVADYGVIAFHF